ncbi:MAG: glycosyltransferase, partial [Candidatus Andersenbacteria bacterium]|nr:glycosyltransferase [Candidatus Andersenbacteria bacterium]
ILRDEYKYKGELETIPTGLELSEFEGLTEEAFYLRFPTLRGKRVLLFAGRLGGEKNVSFLIRMMQELHGRDDTVLVIAGTGKDQDQFKEEAATLVEQGRVVFTGLLDRPVMLSAFKAADLFVFASKTDTQALVLSEAVAAGTPIVMIDDPGLSPALEEGKTAVVVPEHEQAFASEVQRLLDDDAALAALSHNCEQLAPQLSMDFTVDTLIKTYEHVIEDHQSYSWRSRAREALARDVDMKKLFPGIGKGRVNLMKAFKHTRKHVEDITGEEE